MEKVVIVEHLGKDRLAQQRGKVDIVKQHISDRHSAATWKKLS